MAAVWSLIIGVVLGGAGTLFFCGSVKLEKENAYYEQGYRDGYREGQQPREERER
ncbi:MAG: hypothetical protein SPI84_06540 [Anaerovoracaceae bacterium]|nr:hypothetical protein [Anaerovoracaceae bacterium]